MLACHLESQSASRLIRHEIHWAKRSWEGTTYRLLIQFDIFGHRCPVTLALSVFPRRCCILQWAVLFSQTTKQSSRSRKESTSGGLAVDPCVPWSSDGRLSGAGRLGSAASSLRLKARFLSNSRFASFELDSLSLTSRPSPSLDNLSRCLIAPGRRQASTYSPPLSPPRSTFFNREQAALLRQIPEERPAIMASAAAVGANAALSPPRNDIGEDYGGAGEVTSAIGSKENGVEGGEFVEEDEDDDIRGTAKRRGPVAAAALGDQDGQELDEEDGGGLDLFGEDEDEEPAAKPAYDLPTVTVPGNTS